MESIMKVYKFTVEGKGIFPYDMLRHDRCYPTTLESAQAMDCQLCAGMVRGKRKVELIKPVEHIYEYPTAARWESFGWKVIKEVFVR